MGTRLELQTLLENILGSSNVYYQPPESIRMKYPAIVYSLRNFNEIPADNKTYLRKRLYRIQFISRNPDNDVVDKMLDLELCASAGRFVIDNLYHDNFDLYY